jgi:DNA polymerase-1
MSHPNTTLVLLDAHAIIHRGYHALPAFETSAGEPTGALYGLVSMLTRAIQDLAPDELIACFDLPEPTYRHEAYEQYKATRPEADQALVQQIQRSRDVFDAFSIPYYECAGFEADDLLGTIVEQLRERDDIRIIIVTGDMDTLQLVDDQRVQVFTLRKGIRDTVLYDESAVRERFGFSPELLPDFKGLRGDPSDNIPGIAGIGEKTATTLIQQFGGLDSLYKTLESNAAALESAGIKARVQNLLREHRDDAEFSKMLGAIRRDAPITFSMPEIPWRERVSMEAIAPLFDALEFRSLTQRTRAAIGEEAGESKPADTEADVDPEQLKETAVALWLLQSDITNPSLSDILRYADTTSFESARKYILAQIQERNLSRVFEEIEKPLIPVVEHMNECGIALDTRYLATLSRQYHEELDTIAQRIFEAVGYEFNINSPKQLGEALYDHVGLRPKRQKRTSTGQRTTRESELEKMRNEHTVIENILSYRQLQKLLSTYIDTLPTMVGDDGRLHATFLQTGTTTGRLTSQHPNLQNIPIRTKQGRAIRDAFVAADGFELISCDYSQIELRIAAFLSEDEKLIDVFRSGGDIHAAVAREIFTVADEQVDYEMRRKAKAINFGILYGMGVTALQQTLETDRQHAQEFLDAYFERFAGVAQYVERVKREAAEHGYTTTLFGRRRYFPDITSPQPQLRAAAERMAINAPIQGTQADLIKLAMNAIDAELAERGMREQVRLLLQVHDELVFEVATDARSDAIELIASTMQNVLPAPQRLHVPLNVDVAAGTRWGSMEAVERSNKE